MKILMDRFGEDKAIFHSEFPFRDKDLLVSIPGVSFRSKTKEFVAPLTWALCLTARGILGERLDLSQSIIDWATKEGEFQAAQMAARELLEPKAPYLVTQNWGDGFHLYPFQAAGVEFLREGLQNLLADEMGTGKTIQTIATIDELEVNFDAWESQGRPETDRPPVSPFPVLIISLKSMLYTWKAEFDKWSPGLDVVVVDGPKAKRVKALESGADVYIINWEGVRGHSRLAPYGNMKLARCAECDPNSSGTVTAARCEVHPLELNKINFRTIVCDEAHKLGNAKNKQTRAVWAVANSSGAPYRYALTGTPIANTPDQLWAVLHFLKPESFPSKVKFIDRWCLTTFNMFSEGAEVIGLNPNTKDEFYSILNPMMRRIKKEIVLPQLPKKVYSTRFAEMTASQAKAYAEMEQKMITELNDDSRMVALDPLVLQTRLSQFASAMMEASGEVDEEGNPIWRMTNPSNKINALLEVYEELGGKPAVVFCLHRQLLDLTSAKLDSLKIKHSIIVGGQTPYHREEARSAFQDGAVDLILCTIQAGSAGITLTRADTVIFMQRSWSQIDNSQAEDRVHRIGSEIHDQVSIIDIIAPGTVEEKQRESLAQKAEMLEEVVQDRDSLARFLAAKGSE